MPDPWPEDSPETAEWRRAFWDRLIEAIKIACVDLPDWLKASPRFREDRS
jgi:hypothetical protein